MEEHRNQLNIPWQNFGKKLMYDGKAPEGIEFIIEGLERGFSSKLTSQK